MPGGMALRVVIGGNGGRVYGILAGKEKEKEKKVHRAHAKKAGRESREKVREGRRREE